jgi:hypothetical protein
MKTKLETVTTLVLSLDTEEIKTLDDILDCFFDQVIECDDTKLWNEMNHMANMLHLAIYANREAINEVIKM